MNNLLKILAISMVFSLSSFVMTMDSELRSDYAKSFAKEKKSSENKTVVPMWGAEHRFAAANSRAADTIEIDRLSGCIATAALIRYANGSSCSIITHFPLADTVEHAEKLAEQLRACNEKANSQIVSSHLNIARPEVYVKNEQTNFYECRAEIDEKDVLLRLIYREIQGRGAKASLMPYRPYRRVRLSPDDKEFDMGPDLELKRKNGTANLYCNICDTYNTPLQ